MQVRLSGNQYLNTYKRKEYSSTPNNLAPLKRDTVSFGSLKKTQFEGIDFAVVEKFKAPIEKFNTNEDLQNWCDKKIKDEILNKDFGGRSDESKIQRKAMLKEWTDYVLNENTAYNKAIALLILNSITKNLKQDNDKIPPILNKGVLSECVSDIEKDIKLDKKYSFDFGKLYETKLRNFYMEEMNTGETDTKWVVIPSKKHDEKNFEANVEKLKTLSHKNWCTKTFKAEPYLSEGDFHVYLENEQPKLGVRFVENKIQETQGELNNGRIPNDYYDVFESHIKEENLKLNEKAKEEFEYSKDRNAKIEKSKEKLKPVLATNDAAKIYKELGFKVKVDNEGYITLSHYAPTFIYNNDRFEFSELGINEQQLFEKVKRIDGKADFEYSTITDLKNLEYIGSTFIPGTAINGLGKLKHIEGCIFRIRPLNINKDDIKKLDYLNKINLKEIRTHSKTYTPEEIFNAVGIKANRDKDGYLTISEYKQPYGDYCTFSDLGIDENELFKDVKRIKGDARFKLSTLTDLQNLERIDGNACFSGSNITSLGKLEYINEDARFDNSEIEDIGSLKYIGGFAYFRGSLIKDLKNLEIIGGSAYFSNSPVEKLGKLKKINGHAFFSDTNITDLGNLEYIGGNAVFYNSKVTNTGNLKTIGESATFGASNLTSLGNLEYIGSLADFAGSKITDLGNLKYIKGSILCKDSKLTRWDFKHIKRGHSFIFNLWNDRF